MSPDKYGIKNTTNSSVWKAAKMVWSFIIGVCLGFSIQNFRRGRALCPPPLLYLRNTPTVRSWEVYFIIRVLSAVVKL